ncbi:hypothetical protein M408DRAFT_327489 [Serendipita vermifera MAFF 305830]|uniref:Uncharacterized protein n=1 Tax=Serendipita vermifera MAFF 305830 TaxID=933852 RepID=A0A0C2WYR9_SERVB|nr:hypothetical protein M408DRAFT_327489 [Serendipita vermifera MAFF 305830]
MTNWVDFLSVGIILSILVGVVYAVMTVTSKVQDTVKSTQESLNKKGVNLTASGVSVKTDKNLDREAYLDATQRGAINVMKAASFGAPDARKSLSDIDRHTHAPPEKPSDQGTAKKRSIFGKSKK